MKIKKAKKGKEDFFLIEKFFKIQFKGNYSYGDIEYFYWKLFKNKTQNGFINYYIKKDKIIATTSITPKTVLINQIKYIVGEIGDTYVDKKYSGRGLFLNLVKKSKIDSKKLHFIYGTPNHLSLPIYLKYCDFKKNNLFKIYSFVYPLSIKHILRKKVGKSLAFLINIFFNIFQKTNLFYLKIKHSFNVNYKYIKVNSFNQFFDNFWDKASKEWDFIFLRNKKMLVWRFDENPRKYSKLIFKFNNEIIGYLVYFNNHDSINPKIIIADFLFLKKHISAFDYALFILKKIASKEKVDSINLWYSVQSMFTNILSRGFYKNKEVPLIFNLANNCEGNTLTNVHFTISDSDNI